MRALIVDDEDPLRKLLQTWIEGDGGTVIEAGSAEEGLLSRYPERAARHRAVTGPPGAGKTPDGLAQTAVSAGMSTLLDDALAKALAGQMTIEEALRVTIPA